MPQEDDWRLIHRNLVEGHALTWKRWRAPEHQPSWDHDHCSLCTVEISAIPDPGVQAEAYADEVEYNWVCAECARDFQETLQLKLIGGPPAE